MPTFVRLLSALALIAGLTIAAMAALIHFVEPRQRQMSVEVPLPGIVPETPVRNMPDLPE